MDPVSFIVSTYINVVSSTVANNINEIYGTEIQSVTTEYHGHRISYSYQLWKIKPKSVCADQKGHLSTYSACTLEAKILFKDVCNHLQNKKRSDWRYSKNKNMYCNAALSYEPVIASIQQATEPSLMQEARKTCNLAISEHMGNANPQSANAVEKACAPYRSMK